MIIARLKSFSFYLALFLTFLCSIFGRYLATFPFLNILGALVISLLLGIVLQLLPKSSGLVSDYSFISNKFLRLGIILLGFKLNLKTLADSGIQTILLAIFIVIFMYVLTYKVLRLFKVNTELAFLAAGGCSICGAAAVMGMSPQVKANNDDTVLAVAIVAILGTVFTLISVQLYPHLVLNEQQYGILTGGSLHEIAHSIAAAGASTDASVETAIIMKLSRVLLLAPASIIVGLIYQKFHAKEVHINGKVPIPWFMLGFILASVVGTLLSYFVGEAVIPFLKGLELVAYIILGLAMAALGATVNFKVLAKRGLKVLIICFFTSAILYFVVYLIAKFLF